MDKGALPVGKLPLSLLERLLKSIPSANPNVLAGPSVGVDAAVIRFGAETLVFKTDPITFTSDSLPYYLVTINANDIACMGGTPRYILVSFLLPEGKTHASYVESLFEDLKNACEAYGITLAGGHTEITHGLERPLAIGFMIGTLEDGSFIRPANARPSNLILLSKRIPIEATAIIGAEVKAGIDEKLLEEARLLSKDPGISVLKEAVLARSVGGVTAMHDPTEGGLATGLKELSLACGHGVRVYRERIPVLAIAEKILPHFSIDPMGALASGSLVVCCENQSAEPILAAWAENGIEGSVIGEVTAGHGAVLVEGGTERPMPEFAADEIAKIFSS